MAIRTAIVLMLVFGCSSGCMFFPKKLQPQNLWKLNGQPPAGNESMYFSVPDPEQDFGA